MRKTMLTGAIALLIGALALPLSAGATTSEVFESNSVSITFSDLNIQSHAGAKVLYARLKQATKAVCGDDSYREAGSLSRLAETKACYDNTLDEAVSAIDSDALKEIHAG